MLYIYSLLCIYHVHIDGCQVAQVLKCSLTVLSLLLTILITVKCLCMGVHHREVSVIERCLS